MHCYELLKRMKREDPEAKRITSICFSDDKDSPQVQAADLFAYLSRLEAMRIFLNQPYDYEILFRSFGEVMADARHLCMEAEFFGEENLRALANNQSMPIVFAKRVRLPGGQKPKRKN
jgi:hypothetical protein